MVVCVYLILSLKHPEIKNDLELKVRFRHVTIHPVHDSIHNVGFMTLFSHHML